MNRTTITILIIITVVVLLAATGIVFLKQYLPKYKWYPSYSYKSEEPYGTKYLYNILKESYPKKDFVVINQPHNSVIDEDKTNSLLFYIGYDTFYDSLSIEWFKDFMLRGNNICVASTNLPYQLLNDIFNLDSEFFYTNSFSDSTISTLFHSDSLKLYKFHFQNLKKKALTDWNYFSDSTMQLYWKKYTYESLSVLDSGRTNFIRVGYGKGALYVYTTPVLLTNYYLTTPEGFAYANKFFSVIGRSETFYWDNYSKFMGFGYSYESKNPLEFILSKKELRFAWYLLLFGILLFAVFRLKRKQKPIEVILPDKNSSIEYAKAIGLLHYKTSSHSELAAQLMKLFFAFVKERYKITLNKDRDIQKKQIAQHSGINIKIIDDIFREQFSIKYNPEPERGQTIKLHTLLEYFYQNCK